MRFEERLQYDFRHRWDGWNVRYENPSYRSGAFDSVSTETSAYHILNLYFLTRIRELHPIRGTFVDCRQGLLLSFAQYRLRLRDVLYHIRPPHNRAIPGESTF